MLIISNLFFYVGVYDLLLLFPYFYSLAWLYFRTFVLCPDSEERLLNIMRIHLVLRPRHTRVQEAAAVLLQRRQPRLVHQRQ